MKILYGSNCYEILQRVGCPNDYMNDVLFHGLTELEDVEVVDSTRMDHLYKSHKDQFPTIYGRGFTTSYLLDDRDIDRSNIEEKIREYVEVFGLVFVYPEESTFTDGINVKFSHQFEEVKIDMENF